jgi:hypothetical protein
MVPSGDARSIEENGRVQAREPLSGAAEQRAERWRVIVSAAAAARSRP